MKTLKISILALLLLPIMSCQDFLEEDPKGQLAGTELLSTQQGLESALAGTYKPLQFTWISGFNTAALNAVLMGSDDMTTHPASNKQGLRDFDVFIHSDQNDRMPMIWNGCYRSIQNANAIIENFQEATGDPAVINQVGGEAHFLRAFSYYWLTRLWGEIPIIRSSSYSDEILTITKSSVSEVYALIESDLKVAEQLLGDTKPAPGRANLGSAKALLADVYLTMAGWPLKDESKYALAATKAKEVLDGQSTYGFALLDNFEDLWAGSSAGNAEEVFALHFCGGCAWYSANAIWGSACMPSEENGWDDYFAEINFYNNFPEGPRKEATFYTEFYPVDSDPIPWEMSATKHPYFAKFRGGWDTWQTSMPTTMIRLAHVHLIYAEAQAMSSSPDADAYAAVNVIRQRAGLEHLPTGLSQVEFQEAVLQERAWEFAGEYTRWFDLVRSEKVEAANADKHADEIPITVTIGKEQYWLPIPASEVAINPNLGN